ncbi:U4/U6 small nuclear ribonucleoprotein Prp3 [Trifolium pratense]|uniref:U4/U6 small nuclear ribonucleoprotein Prp3 n=1 Tax=Trifolium pratense TaxID=57577 RepID=A0A2K3MLG2_TRIPR|nr:U4/U6 small nuclear ribonucleoprotein Prp3 [Trifolium pratense]
MDDSNRRKRDRSSERHRDHHRHHRSDRNVKHDHKIRDREDREGIRDRDNKVYDRDEREGSKVRSKLNCDEEREASPNHNASPQNVRFFYAFVLFD